MKARKSAAAAILFVIGYLATLFIIALPVSANHYIGHHWSHSGLANSQIYFVDRPETDGPSHSLRIGGIGPETWTPFTKPPALTHACTASALTSTTGTMGILASHISTVGIAQTTTGGE